MNVNAPILDVVPGPRGLMLNALTRLVGRMSGRELAQFAGVPSSTAARVLADLVDAGIVEAEPVGAALAYRLNPDHLVAKAINDLAGTRVELVQRIKDEIINWQVRPIGAWLFGSTARGDGDRRSDIDLLFVAPDGVDDDQWEAQLGRLANLVEHWTGNHVQILEHTVASFLALEADRSSLTANVHVDGLELVDGSWAAIARSA